MNSMNEQVSNAADQEQQQLIACARAGNAEAFEKLVRPHWDQLRGVTRRILRNRHDAEDAAQILDVSVATVKARLYRARGTVSRKVQPMLQAGRRRGNGARGAVLAPRTAASA